MTGLNSVKWYCLEGTNSSNCCIISTVKSGFWLDNFPKTIYIYSNEIKYYFQEDLTHSRPVTH